MAGLTPYILSALGVIIICLSAAYARLRARLRALSSQAQNFLSGGGQPTRYSVREDSLAHIQNAIAETQSRLLNEKARADEERLRATNLTADISHQLKTPLASLRLFCEMDAGAHEQEQIAQIERMERLIYALLRLERLSADGYAFTFADNSVSGVIRAAWSGLETIYGAREMVTEGDAMARCDAKWLREAFSNILKNACEHTKEGSRIRARVEELATSVLISVEDDGGGVPPNDIKHIFERFYRARNERGAGIGLAITREIIRRHHGEIRAENASEGLCIYITLPILNLAKS